MLEVYLHAMLGLGGYCLTYPPLLDKPTMSAVCLYKVFLVPQ